MEFVHCENLRYAGSLHLAQAHPTGVVAQVGHYKYLKLINSLELNAQRCAESRLLGLRVDRQVGCSTKRRRLSKMNIYMY